MHVVPSPTAAMSALAISGLSTSRFSFEGFLSVTKKQRQSHLNEIKNFRRTLIFYEAPHKLIYTLEDLLENLGDRRIALCRELTKIHEEVLRGKISEMLEYYKEKSPKGEYVLIVEGAPEEETEQKITLEKACEMAQQLVENGKKASEAAKEIAKLTGFSKSEIYGNIAIK